MDLFELANYCCDARLYLLAGQSCAETGNCYEAIRPMGTTYWFSIPYRLGLSPSVLVMLHLALMLASIVLSVFAIRRLYENHYATKITLHQLVFVVIGNSLAHIIFLYPVLWLPLSDTPADLLLLIGIWLLLLSNSPQPKRIYFLIAAGLCLGLAAFIRAFFLYPVLAALVIWFVFWCFNWQREKRDLAILVMLIPILIQTITTLEKTGRFAYLPPDATAPWIDTHLNSTITGYDTILPFDYYAWYSDCENYGSLLEAAQHFDPHSIICVISGKMHFYFGSYSPYTYHPESSALEIISNEVPIPTFLSPLENQLTNNVQESVLNPSQTLNMQIFPGLQNQLNKIWKNNPSHVGETTLPVALERGSIYRLSMLLAAPTSIHSIVLGVRDLQKNVIASQGALLTTYNENNEAHHARVEAVIDRSNIYEVFIQSGVYDRRPTPSAGYTVNTEFFYAWNVQLRKITKQPPVTRSWSIWILIANSFALIGTLTVIAKTRKSLTPLQKLAIVMLLFCGCQMLLVVPEQRFAITTLLSIWIFCIAWITTLHMKTTQHADTY